MDLTSTVNIRGLEVYHCPKCTRDWVPLNRIYWRFGQTITEELCDQPLDGVMLCHPCEFNSDTRGDVRCMFIS